MGDVSLDMIWKRLEEMQAGQEAIRVELVAVNGKMGGMATTLVGIQRDIRNLQATVATLGVAVNDHTHQLAGMGVRLDRIETRIGLHDAE
jgi:hypothetical protein